MQGWRSGRVKGLTAVVCYLGARTTAVGRNGEKLVGTLRRVGTVPREGDRANAVNDGHGNAMAKSLVV